MEDKVTCNICGKNLSCVNWFHLNGHNITVAEYRKIYPDAKLVNDAMCKKRREAGLRRSPELIQKMKDAAIASGHLKGRKMHYSEITMALRKESTRLVGLKNRGRKMHFSEQAIINRREASRLVGLSHKGKKVNWSEANLKARAENIKKAHLSNIGRKQTPERVKQRVDQIKGMSYEQLLGKEHADKLKAQRRASKFWVVPQKDKIKYVTMGSKKARYLYLYDEKHREKYTKHLADSLQRYWDNISEEDKNSRISNVVRSVIKKPNKPEQYLLNILKFMYPNEWEYVGNGSFMIAGKNPDFVNVNHKKLIIELFGDYWHKDDDPNERMNIFLKCGYDTLIIWERELKDITKLSKRIVKFVKNYENSNNVRRNLRVPNGSSV